MKKIFAAMVFVSMVLVSGCAGDTASTVSEDTFMTVNGEVVTVDDFARNKALFVQGQGSGEVADDNRELIDYVVRKEVVMQKADKEDVQVSPAEIELSMEQVIEPYGSREIFEEIIGEKGLDFEDFRRAMVYVLTYDALQQDFAADIVVTDEEAEEFYRGNEIMFYTGGQVRARHILVDTREEAEDIIARINAGESMEDLAAELSKCPSGKSSGGDLGFFAREDMVAPFSEAAFAMAPGEVSGEPVETSFGFHVIRVEEKVEEGLIPFDDVREEIISGLQQEKAAGLFAEEIEEEFRNAEVKIY